MSSGQIQFSKHHLLNDACTTTAMLNQVGKTFKCDLQLSTASSYSLFGHDNLLLCSTTSYNARWLVYLQRFEINYEAEKSVSGWLTTIVP